MNHINRLSTAQQEQITDLLIEMFQDPVALRDDGNSHQKDQEARDLQDGLQIDTEPMIIQKEASIQNLN